MDPWIDVNLEGPLQHANCGSQRLDIWPGLRGRKLKMNRQQRQKLLLVLMGFGIFKPEGEIKQP